MPDRVQKMGDGPDYSLRRRVEATFDATFALCNELHYMSCSGGVGKPGQD